MGFIRKRWLILISVLVIVCSVIIYYQRTYFFNPITFRNNNVLYLPYKWYKKPLQVQVVEINLNNSTAIRYTTFDPNQVRFVVGELEKGTIVQQPKYSQNETAIVHISMRSGSQVDSTILQDAMIQKPNFSNVAQIYTQVPGHAFPQYITLTPELQKWVSDVLKRGERVR